VLNRLSNSGQTKEDTTAAGTTQNYLQTWRRFLGSNVLILVYLRGKNSNWVVNVIRMMFSIIQNSSHCNFLYNICMNWKFKKDAELLEGMKTKVVNIHKKEPYDVYIGRGKESKWGNPFTHLGGKTLAEFKVATREEAIEKYREWIKTQPELLASLGELKGKRLGCFCKPDSCHGDVLAELADEWIDPSSCPC
jgi:hypothetical protein